MEYNYDQHIEKNYIDLPKLLCDINPQASNAYLGALYSLHNRHIDYLEHFAHSLREVINLICKKYWLNYKYHQGAKMKKTKIMPMKQRIICLKYTIQYDVKHSNITDVDMKNIHVFAEYYKTLSRYAHHGNLVHSRALKISKHFTELTFNLVKKEPKLVIKNEDQETL